MIVRNYQPVLLKRKDEYACVGSHAVLATVGQFLHSRLAESKKPASVLFGKLDFILPYNRYTKHNIAVLHVFMIEIGWAVIKKEYIY